MSRKSLADTILSWGKISIAAQEYISCVFFGIAHAYILCSFVYLGVKEMAIYNIFSVLFFIVSAYLIRTEKIGEKTIVYLVCVEIILHQTLAIIFVGIGFGYQYILFALSIPIMGFMGDKVFKRIINFIACCSFTMFVMLMALYNTGSIEPIYDVTVGMFSGINTMVMLSAGLLTDSFLLISSYCRFEMEASESKMKEVEAQKRQVRIRGQIIDSIANIIESRDLSTGEHILRTSQYVESIIDELRNNDKYNKHLTKEMSDIIISASSLHDIGKIQVPDTILNKPGKLDTDEFEIIKEHTWNGGRIIRKILSDVENDEYVEVAYDIATYHHERYDGKGYPFGLEADEIPICARIMAVADVYDALLSKRVYKDSFSKDKATNIIIEGSGTQFDPDVVNAFIKLRQSDVI